MRLTPELVARAAAKEVNLLQMVQEDAELYADLALQIQTKAGTQVPFTYNSSQRLLHEKVEELKKRHGKIRVILLKARQFGGSTYIAGRLFKQVATSGNQNAKVIAHAADHAVKLLEMYHRFYNSLPSELQPLKKYQSKSELTFANPDPDPAKRRENPGLNSSLGVYSAKTAGAGRGSTLRYLHCSEVACWDDADKVMLGLLNTVPAGEMGAGTEVFIESTANGVGNYFYNLYQRAKRQEVGTDFHAIFLPWYLHEEYTLKAPDGFKNQLTQYERDLIEREHEDWEYDSPETGKKSLSLNQVYWRRVTISTLCENDELRFRQEYPLTDEEAFVTSGLNFFDVEMVQTRLADVMKNVHAEFMGDLEYDVASKGGRRKSTPRLVENPLTGKLTIWEKPVQGEAYVYFADVSEGLRESDFQVVDVFARKSGSQVAQWRGRIDPDKLADIIFDLGHYYNWAYGTPESNNHGLTCLIRLRDMGYPYLYKRLTYDLAYDRQEREQEGWLTTQRTRPIMLDALRRMFRDKEILINSVVTLEEMKTFIKERNKYQAQAGCNDDCVMCAAGACQMLMELPDTSRNKRKSYVEEGGAGVQYTKRTVKYDRVTGAVL